MCIRDRSVHLAFFFAGGISCFRQRSSAHVECAFIFYKDGINIGLIGTVSFIGGRFFLPINYIDRGLSLIHI